MERKIPKKGIVFQKKTTAKTTSRAPLGLHLAMATCGLVLLAQPGCDSRPSTTASAAIDLPGKTAAGKTAAGKTDTQVDTQEETEPQEDTEPIEATIEATFDDLKFEMEKTERFVQQMLTERVIELLDRSIRIRGYIYPTHKKRGLQQFVLVRDNLECCFGPGAALFDCILVRMEPGLTAEFSIRPVTVEGTLRLQEVLGPDSRQLVIYQLEGRSVR